MSWDSLFMPGLIVACTAFGMIMGAWIAARGFEKALIQTMQDPEAPWNRDKINK